MSTHIGPAWIINTDKLKPLIKIGQRVESLHRDSIVKEIIARLRYLPWTEENLKALRSVPEKTLFSIIRCLRSLTAMNKFRSFINPESAYYELDKTLKNFELEQSLFTMLLPIMTDVYEMIMQYSGAGVSFVPSTSGKSLMVGFALTDDAIKWCNDHFADFHYQDSTDEPLSAFSLNLDKYVDEWAADRDDIWSHEDIERVKSMLSAYEQNKRGKVWDSALGDCTTFAEAGLSHRCYTSCFGPGEIAVLVCRKLFGLDVDKKEAEEK